MYRDSKIINDRLTSKTKQQPTVKPEAVKVKNIADEGKDCLIIKREIAGAEDRENVERKKMKILIDVD